MRVCASKIADNAENMKMKNDIFMEERRCRRI